ncbi:MAG: DedA family protein, partial [Neobacillus sp.]
LVRHSKKNYMQIFIPLFGILAIIGLGIANIALTNTLPSDIVGGYVYGGVWIFFNFLLFEMLRLILEKYSFKNE